MYQNYLQSVEYGRNAGGSVHRLQLSLFLYLLSQPSFYEGLDLWGLMGERGPSTAAVIPISLLSLLSPESGYCSLEPDAWSQAPWHPLLAQPFEP